MQKALHISKFMLFCGDYISTQLLQKHFDAREMFTTKFDSEIKLVIEMSDNKCKTESIINSMGKKGTRNGSRKLEHVL